MIVPYSFVILHAANYTYRIKDNMHLIKVDLLVQNADERIAAMPRTG